MPKPLSLSQGLENAKAAGLNRLSTLLDKNVVTLDPYFHTNADNKLAYRGAPAYMNKVCWQGRHRPVSLFASLLLGFALPCFALHADDAMYAYITASFLQ